MVSTDSFPRARREGFANRREDPGFATRPEMQQDVFRRFNDGKDSLLKKAREALLAGGSSASGQQRGSGSGDLWEPDAHRDLATEPNIGTDILRSDSSSSGY